MLAHQVFCSLLGTAEADRRISEFVGNPCTYISDLGVDMVDEDNITT